MKKFIISLFIFSLLMAPNQGLAGSAERIDTFKPSPWTTQETYIDLMTHKLGFGVFNVLTGWSAIPFEWHRNSNKITGLAKGILRTVTNTVGGGLHAFTFPIPFDIPLPDGGVNFDE